MKDITEPTLVLCSSLVLNRCSITGTHQPWGKGGELGPFVPCSKASWVFAMLSVELREKAWGKNHLCRVSPCPFLSCVSLDK